LWQPVGQADSYDDDGDAATALWMGVLKGEDPVTTQLLYGEYRESDEDFNVDEVITSLLVSKSFSWVAISGL
jgi:hypothetical protein